jgi:hypothetical protein
MQDRTTSNSLLPYLMHGGAHFYLYIPLAAETLAGVGRLNSRFITVSDTHPLYHIHEAQLFTDAKSRVKRVFLLMQKDAYTLPRDDLWPVNNRDIDGFWQTTFSYITTQESGSIVLSNQITQENELNPLHPLFFCLKKQVFFHTVCPRCGLILQQCYDDNLLVRLGLEAYSTSLRRYLCCPTCLKSGEGTDFYVFEATGLEPVLVKDRWNLLQQYGQMSPNKKQANKVPCSECPERAGCYGLANEVRDNLIPFSFYPFYMIIFEAMSLQAPDFLALLSGASFEELESSLLQRGEEGRIHCLNTLKQERPPKSMFLFAEDDRYFLEVFYLKLSFLAELTQIIFNSPFVSTRPDLGLSIDQIWVSLPDQGDLLPSFWNFKVSPVALMTKSLEAINLPDLPLSYGLYFLSLSWFYALVVNSKQDISKVHKAVGVALAQSSPGDLASFEKILDENSGRTFALENIFWKPEGNELSKSHNSLWKEALQLGWSLLRASYHLDADWSESAFWQRLEGLREEVKDYLFRATTMPYEQKYRLEREVAIQNILERILGKWRDKHEKNGIKETIIMSPEDLEEDARPATLEQNGENEEIPETIFISNGDTSQKPSDFSSGLQPNEFTSDKEKSASEARKLPSDSQVRDEEEMIPETVVLSPEQAARMMSASSSPKQVRDLDFRGEEPPSTEIPRFEEGLHLDSHAKDEEEMISETVIISPLDVSLQPSAPYSGMAADEDATGEEKGKPPKDKIKKPSGDDFVVETVFLSPGKAKEENAEDSND